MRFTYQATIEVELERESGKFATRDEMAEQLREAIESALQDGNPGELVGENEGEYVVSFYEYELVEGDATPTGAR